MLCSLFAQYDCMTWIVMIVAMDVSSNKHEVPHKKENWALNYSFPSAEIVAANTKKKMVVSNGS